MSELENINVKQLELVKYPDPRLKLPNKTVEVFDDKLREFVEAMYDYMDRFRGVGLAAPQVGVNIRLFTANPSGESDDYSVYINPEIISNEGKEDGEEGCLSFPGISCHIKRFSKTVIRAQDLDGSTFEETGEGLLARIFQHESDHLDGVLLIDRMSTIAKMTNRSAINSLKDAFAG